MTRQGDEGLARLLKAAGHTHTHDPTANQLQLGQDREEGCEMTWLGLCWRGHAEWDTEQGQRG